MKDFSHLDQKYFIDSTVYNCPFCNRNNVKFTVVDEFQFNWSEEKECFGILVKCSSCGNLSMHLSYEKLVGYYQYSDTLYINIDDDTDVDSLIFYSVPTSFFVIDERIPKAMRELITEAEGCLKMNFLTGASACARKAIYELTIHEKSQEKNYGDKIKGLKKKYPNTDGELFDILAQIQNMTSDKVHEQSWPEWDPKNLSLIIETLKTVLFDIYVLPQIKTERSLNVKALLEKVRGKKTTEEGDKEKTGDIT